MSKKLLLADDSITIQKVIQITFAHEDYELTITDNGDSALAKAQEIKPDLVMADVYMPGKNGYELASAIKQDSALQHVPVLLLAGSFEPFDEDKARSCKADAWIEKPFESQNLIDKVAELLSSTRQTPAVAAPVAEPEPVAAVEPEPVAEVAVEETPLATFDEPAGEPEIATTPADPFGDISFEEEAPKAEPTAVADNWSDAAVADFDAFAMDDDEIMPLGDDDILGEEDLEPIMQEQSLATWSRDEPDVEDAFVESLAEIPADEVEAKFPPSAEAVFVEEAPAFVMDESVVEETPDFEEVVAEAIPEEVAPAIVEEPEPVPVAANMADVVKKAAAMSETELEQIIEKVVTKVVEKLADSILERVAWDVVPDLAENMIREEIRKIKDAAA